MGLKAISAVLAMQEELTDVEFRLLINLADCPDDGVLITPNWGSILRKSRLLESQANRILDALQLHHLIKTTGILFGGIVSTGALIHIIGMDSPTTQREVSSTGESAQERRPNPGYVYLMHAVGTEWYKIGFSVNPEQRSEALAAKAPYDVEIVHMVQVSDMRSVESYWHERFASKRVNGEWFTLDDDDIAEFCSAGDRYV